jgi:hypothetical protein
MLIVAWLGLPRSIDYLIADVPAEDTAGSDLLSDKTDQGTPGLSDLQDTSLTHAWLEASSPLERRAPSIALHSFTTQHTPPIVLPPPEQN